MKRLYSAIKPSGDLTIGNYIGALKHWKKMQDEYECYFAVADLHAITVRQDPELLRERSRLLAAVYLASGIDPQKAVVYIQSHVAEHAELAWVLHCLTYLGELNRMHQFKSKIKDNEQNANAGLYCYPILMAADLLLYQTNVVPVGDDQKQHVEIARDIALRFNNAFGDTFDIPEVKIAKTGARIKDLQDPSVKMSKSADNPNGYVLLLEQEKDIVKKIKKSVTDSLGVVRYTEDQPGLKNLIDIYHVFSDESIEDIVSKYEGMGYGALKKDLIQVIENVIGPIRDTTAELLQKPDYLDDVLEEGRKKAQARAQETLQLVYDKVGFLKRR